MRFDDAKEKHQLASLPEVVAEDQKLRGSVYIQASLNFEIAATFDVF
jgi:hypothetical protein